jgi:hypothetical protein
MKLLAALALAFASGCTTYAPLDGLVCVDPKAPDGVFEAALKATGSWNDAPGSPVDMSVVATLKNETCAVDIRDKSLSPSIGQSDCGFLRNPRIRIDFDDIEPDLWWLAIAHELGHAIGAEEHSVWREDVMYRHVTGYQVAVTARDISKVTGD